MGVEVNKNVARDNKERMRRYVGSGTGPLHRQTADQPRLAGFSGRCRHSPPLPPLPLRLTPRFDGGAEALKAAVEAGGVVRLALSAAFSAG